MKSKSGKDKDSSKRPLSRRSFLKGAALTSAGAVAAVATLGHLAHADASAPALADGVAEQLGPGPVDIELKLNGATHRLAIEPRVTLVRALREHLGMTGTKLVCDRGSCGACTVHLDGQPVTSCMMLAVDARGHEITTIEGLGNPDRMHPVQDAFVHTDAMQCGFCTPGMAMSIAAALAQNPTADLDAIRKSIAGNICRCGTYPHVFAAALKVARAKGSA
ncbi:MAG: 2Fe-2S iron-sulfur cluster-binding protein [Candidatus Binataceae bacterium]